MKRKGIISAFLTLFFLITQIGTLSVQAEVVSDTSLLEISKTISNESIRVGETFQSEYTITPQNIPVSAINEQNNKEKEIVLVIDTSGSMNENMVDSQGKTSTRLSIMKSVANNFITKFKDNKNVKISLVDFNNYASVIFDMNNISTTSGQSEDVALTEDNIEGICDELGIDVYNNIYCLYRQTKSGKYGYHKYSMYMRDNNKNLYFYPDKLYVKIGSEYIQVLNKSDLIREFNIDNSKLGDMNITSKINNLIANGGTNIGDGLRKAKYAFSSTNSAEKYIILMSDGFPTAFSGEKGTVSYYPNGEATGEIIYGSENTPKSQWNHTNFSSITSYVPKVSGDDKTTFAVYYNKNGQAVDYDNRALDYSKVIASTIGDTDIKTYVVGFSNGTNSDKLQAIADSAKGDYYSAADAEAINNVYNNIATEIKSDLKGETYFEEILPEGIEVVKDSLPSWISLSADKRTLRGTLNFDYTLDDTRQFYKPLGTMPVEFTIELKGITPGKVTLAPNSTSYVNLNIKDKEGTMVKNSKKYFSSKDINIFKELSILEVQPSHRADSFELDNSIFGSNSQCYKILNITQMSMPEFISNIEKINGKYDLVYIGDKVVNNIDYSALGAKPTKIPPKASNGSFMANGSYSTEYYSENDITNKRALELEEFINSGQLTIFNNKIFNNTFKNTKLYNNFQKYSNNRYSNFKTVDSFEYLTSNLAQWYNQAAKRPELNIINSPNQYDGTEASYQANKLLEFKFDLYNSNRINGASNLMDIKLYLDINGDGLFKEAEMVKRLSEKVNGDEYLFDYRMDTTFTGLMPWKLEIVDLVNNSKSFFEGATAFRGDPLNVRVLQLTPTNNGLNIGTQLKVPLYKTGEYNIITTNMTLNDFDTKYPNDVNGKKTYLNGNYDMIILGFGDSFTSGDLKNPVAIQAIKDFIATGQSVMFTHDTMHYNVNRTSGDTLNLTNYFRDIIGQSRYKDDFNPTEANPSIDVVNADGSISKLGGEKIPHDPLPPSATKSLGFTIPILGKAESKNDHIHSTESNKLNTGLITQYPYVLADNFTITDTHNQYFQLNLEDENVIPWFTIKGSNLDQYDGRNYYYTYTKGNITYSGTGHQTPTSVEEHKLFINTIIKASRGANHAPTLEVINLQQGQNVSKAQEYLQFSFMASDMDKNDILSGNVFINNTEVMTYAPGVIKSGQYVNVSISKNKINQIVGEENNFTIKLAVKDQKNAMISQAINVNYVDTPTIELSFEGTKDYLVGDIANVKLKAIATNRNSNISTELQNVSVTTGITDGQAQPITNGGLELTSTSQWNIGSIPLAPKSTSQEVSKQFTFRANAEGAYIVNNNLSYKISNLAIGNQVVRYTYPISVRSSTIDVKVLKPNGSVFAPTEVTINDLTRNTTEKVTTNAAGIATLVNKPSGRYTFSIAAPKGYEVVEGANKTIEVSYNNYRPTVSFQIRDNKAPSGVISYSTTELTNGNVIATLTTDEPVTIRNNAGNSSYTFEENGEFTFYFVDSDGNEGSVTANVTNIDKTPPTATVHYTTLPNGHVLATLLPSEQVVMEDSTGVIETDGNFTHEFESPGEFTFKFKDLAGNSGTALAKVEGQLRIVKQGLFINGKIVESPQSETNVVNTLKTSFAVEFEVFDNNLNVDFSTDTSISNYEYTLYRVENNNLVQPEGGTVNITSGSSTNRILSKSNLNYSHYILVYKIKFNLDTSRGTVKVNNSTKINNFEALNRVINVIPLPIIE